MKIIEPKVELWQQGEDPIAHVARCARVCYGNAVSKGEEADKRLYESLKKSGHLSMFRHESVYAIIPHTLDNESLFWSYIANPYIQIKFIPNKSIYVATNKNFIIDKEHEITDDKHLVYIGGKPLYNLPDVIKEYQVTPEYFANTEIGHSMMRYTFHVDTQISTSRELNRASPNCISEMSTRFIAMDGTIVNATGIDRAAICRPHWMTDEMLEQYDSYVKGDAFALKDPMLRNYIHSTWDSFDYYKSLLTNGMKREDARGVLPLDTATEVVYTYSINEWKHVIKLRADKKAHPNCQIIANMIKEQLEQLGYDF